MQQIDAAVLDSPNPLDRPTITISADNLPEEAEYYLGDLLVLLVQEGRLTYSYPDELPASYWEKPLSVVIDGNEVASIEDDRAQTFFKLVRAD